MKIAMIASECVPFAKSGGLADVVGALPKSLKKAGNDVVVIMPLYQFIDRKRFGLKTYFETLGVWMGDTEEWCKVHKTEYDSVSVYFIEFDKYFNREGMYHDDHHHDYDDNAKRFAFLSRAALQLCIDMNFKADIVHAHDWQAALSLAYLKLWHWDSPVLKDAAGILTIHNIGYQGVYNAHNYPYIGLGWNNFTPDKFEDHGKINFLKGGIQYADIVNTVSPTYAKETKTADQAYGMAPYLNRLGDRYLGILNGVDYDLWNPEKDTYIPKNYSVSKLSGKSICKKALQKRFHLDEDKDIPVIGIVSRFADQKGLYLLRQVIEAIISRMHVQFAIVGSGEKGLEKYFRELPGRFPGQVGSYIGYNNELAHLLEAGADFFLMPSLYEPCGLNQIYSLRYGTLPIVRATGGLEDTVEQYDEETASGTGFKFNDSTPNALHDTIGWAVSTFYDRKEHIEKMKKAAMVVDFSWDHTAHEYVEVYKKAIKIHRR